MPACTGRLHPPVPPSLPAQLRAASGVPRDQHHRSAAPWARRRDAEVKGGIPAAVPWESGLGQGQVTGASLQHWGRRGDCLTCKHHDAMSLAASSPHQHLSRKVCRKMGQLSPTGCWGGCHGAGAASGLTWWLPLCTKRGSQRRARRSTAASGDWRGTQEPGTAPGDLTGILTSTAGRMVPPVPASHQTDPGSS